MLISLLDAPTDDDDDDDDDEDEDDDDDEDDANGGEGGGGGGEEDCGKRYKQTEPSGCSQLRWETSNAISRSSPSLCDHGPKLADAHSL